MRFRSCSLDARIERVSIMNMNGKYQVKSEYGGMLSVREAALALGCSTETVRRYVRSGKLEAVQPAHTIFIPREALIDFTRRSSMSRSQRIDLMLDQLAELVPRFTPEQKMKLCSLMSAECCGAN